MDRRKFSPWNPNNEHRAYYMAHNVLYDMANDYFTEIEKNTPLVHIRGRDPISYDRYKASGRHPWFNNPQYYFPKWSGRGKTLWLDQKCESWFFNHCSDMIKGMFNCEGFKDIEGAIKGTKNYKELCNRWDAWFEKRRKRFLEKMNTDIMKLTGVPAKMPSSHGGVANLLKVLTKTMEQQGASIQSIAKVQYAVASQAGVYIPNEFLTDVAVALDYKEQM